MESLNFVSGLALGAIATVVFVAIGAFIGRLYRDWRKDMEKPWSPQSVMLSTARTPWQIVMDALRACFSCLVFTAILIAFLSFVSMRLFGG